MIPKMCVFYALIYPNNSLAAAKMVEVLPVPGGP